MDTDNEYSEDSFISNEEKARERENTLMTFQKMREALKINRKKKMEEEKEMLKESSISFLDPSNNINDLLSAKGQNEETPMMNNNDPMKVVVKSIHSGPESNKNGEGVIMVDIGDIKNPINQRNTGKGVNGGRSLPKMKDNINKAVNALKKPGSSRGRGGISRNASKKFGKSKKGGGGMRKRR